MQDAQVLRLDLIQRINNLPSEALRQASELIASIEAQLVSIYKKEREYSAEQAPKLFPAKYQEVQRELIDIYGYNPDADDDRFVDDITWDEYFSMSDDSQSRLWGKLEKNVTVELKELEVTSHAVPV